MSIIYLMKLGAHLSISGGLDKAIENVVNIGGNCLQIFSTSPRMWKNPSVTEEMVERFKTAKEKFNIDPVYFHATYLISLGENGRVGQLSKDFLIAELSVAAKLGVRGSIVHLGSFKDGIGEKKQIHNQQTVLEEVVLEPSAGLHPVDIDGTIQNKYSVLVGNILQILDNTPKETLFMIENAGNRKIGLKLEEISHIIKSVGSPRFRVCLDTCHLHAAGYDIKTEEKLDAFLNEFDKLVGLDRLELFHINDSKDLFGSLRDRHENIGEGHIGLEPFRVLLNHPKTKNLSLIIETPGFENKGPDKKNLDILKELII
ncbi:MAG: putative endonuclease 4 [Candidatus Gottesmanbacteria bacterium GW2011_GWC2_39_8]|uniref:Probable endonuclease 4 n=1 Tax=Candidatus Gottesmanbacteria bacterium GW2011_GWC2_39_8 TaxID=1618450 RepID=A0A0G0Q4Z1_9BACT|nr:MAG: putative endonuclease 4 [Candidatus Gottesmanbacteria bacterium GW2011_GWC2_39_8]